MQTFLPYDSFYYSARVLDNQRLGKQRVETLQLLNALAGLSKGWTNHPAARMWRGYEHALAQYGLVMCREWITRGFKDTCFGKIKTVSEQHFGPCDFHTLDDIVWPSWLGDQEFHLSHKSNLIRKDPERYGWRWADVPDDLPYVWPVAA